MINAGYEPDMQKKMDIFHMGGKRPQLSFETNCPLIIGSTNWYSPLDIPRNRLEKLATRVCSGDGSMAERDQRGKLRFN